MAPKDKLGDIKDAIRSAPDAGVAQTDQVPSHIGVPSGFTPPINPALASTRTLMGAPASEWHGQVLYQNGDEGGPANNPELVPQLQAQLVAIGFLDDKNRRPGVWDGPSRAAYKKLLAFANQNGMTAQQAFAALYSNPTVGELQGGDGRAPLTVELTNPLDIAATAQLVAQKKMGMSIPDDMLQELIKTVQASESGAQRKAYAMGGAKGSGGTIVTPASVESQADDYFKKNYPTETYGYAAVEAMNEFYSLLASPVPGAGQ